MNRTTLLHICQLSVASLLTVSIAGAHGQAPSALPQGLAIPALLSPAEAVISAVPSLQPAASALEPATGSDSSLVLVAAEPAVSSSTDTMTSPDGLPDAPSAVDLHVSLQDSFAQAASGQATPTVAPRLTKYIPSGWTAQSITGRDKFLIGLRDLYSPLDFIAMIASAGYEHVLNGEPNYGTDRGAFGQRLGAAAIRETSQGFFTDSVFAPILHEDPRYYIQGSGRSFGHRLVYAATRPFITKTDSGNSSVNGALLLGYASSAALSYTYYPQINKNFHDTASTFGGSIGGAALGYVVSEFSDDLLKAVHLKK